MNVSLLACFFQVMCLYSHVLSFVERATTAIQPLEEGVSYILCPSRVSIPVFAAHDFMSTFKLFSIPLSNFSVEYFFCLCVHCVLRGYNEISKTFFHSLIPPQQYSIIPFALAWIETFTGDLIVADSPDLFTFLRFTR